MRIFFETTREPREQYWIDPTTCELRVNGKTHVLQEKPFEILAVFVENAGDLVERNELRDFWPPHMDADLNLNQAIHYLRTVFPDRDVLETLRGRGYRLHVRRVVPSEKADTQTGSPIETTAEPARKTSANVQPAGKTHAASQLAEHAEKKRPAPMERRPPSPRHWAVVFVIVFVALAIGLAFLSRRRWAIKPQRNRELKVASENPAALQRYRQAIRAFEDKDFDSMRGQFHDATEIDPTFAMAYFQWSVSEAFWGVTDRVVQLASKADELRETESSPNRYLIQSWYLYVGDRYAAADSLLKSALKQFQTEPEFLYHVGRFYWRELHDAERALSFYKLAAIRWPNDATIANELAYCYSQAGLPEAACRSARKYIRLRPHEANPYDTMGDIIGNIWPDSSEYYYRLAISKKGNFWVSCEKLAYASLWNVDFDEARRLFRQLVETSDPNDPLPESKGRTGLGNVAICEGKLSEALVILSEGIQRDTNAGEPARRERAQKHALRALIYEELSLFEDALAETDSAIALSVPSYQTAPDHYVSKRVGLLLRMGQREHAYREAVARLGGDTVPPKWAYATFMTKARIHLAERQPALAANEILRALELRKDGEFLCELAHTYAMAGRKQQAIATYAELFSTRLSAGIRGNPVGLIRAYFEHGQLLEQSGDLRRACDSYRRFLAFWGTRSDVSEVDEARRAVASSGQFIRTQVTPTR